MDIPVPVQLVQALASYLAEKPWREVDNLLRGLNAAAERAAQKPVPEGEISDQK